jgi:hypothetical protein
MEVLFLVTYWLSFCYDSPVKGDKRSLAHPRCIMMTTTTPSFYSFPTMILIPRTNHRTILAFQILTPTLLCHFFFLFFCFFSRSCQAKFTLKKYAEKKKHIVGRGFFIFIFIINNNKI